MKPHPLSRWITNAVYGLTGICVVAAAAFVIVQLCTDFWKVTRFRPRSNCVITIWHGDHFEPGIYHFYYEFEREGRTVIPKTQFASSGRNDLTFRPVTSVGCGFFGVSCYPETNRVYVLIELDAPEPVSSPSGMKQLQECLPGRRLIFDSSESLPHQGLASAER